MKRDITAADKPELVEIILAWKKTFSFDMEKAFLAMLFMHNTKQQILHAFSVTEAWANSQKIPVTLRDIEKYTLGVVRKNAVLVEKINRILGVQ